MGTLAAEDALEVGLLPFKTLYNFLPDHGCRALKKKKSSEIFKNMLLIM